MVTFVVRRKIRKKGLSNRNKGVLVHPSVVVVRISASKCRRRANRLFRIFCRNSKTNHLAVLQFLVSINVAAGEIRHRLVHDSVFLVRRNHSVSTRRPIPMSSVIATCGALGVGAFGVRAVFRAAQRAGMRGAPGAAATGAKQAGERAAGVGAAAEGGAAAGAEGAAAEGTTVFEFKMPDFSKWKARFETLDGFEKDMSRKEALRILNLNLTTMDREVIKKTHRELLVKNHPDRGGKNHPDGGGEIHSAEMFCENFIMSCTDLAILCAARPVHAIIACTGRTAHTQLHVLHLGIDSGLEVLVYVVYPFAVPVLTTQLLETSSYNPFFAIFATFFPNRFHPRRHEDK